MKYGLIEDSLLEYAGRSGRLLAAVETALWLLEAGDIQEAEDRLRKAIQEEDK